MYGKKTRESLWGVVYFMREREEVLLLPPQAERSKTGIKIDILLDGFLIEENSFLWI